MTHKTHIAAAAMMAISLTASAKPQQALVPTEQQQKLHQHISVTMPKSVRTSDGTDAGGNFALPKPFSVPCVTGGFHNMFYWDTYYTNAGLLLDGDKWQARNNIEDIAAMVERFGYMPNATCQGMLNRSQPPHFSLMVRDYYDATGDKEFLAQILPSLQKEYEFWMTKRIAPNGLNMYGHQATPAELSHFCRAIAGRVGLDTSNMYEPHFIEKGAHLLAEAESGWDFNPRFDGRCWDFNPVDLNSLLYAYEMNFAYFLNELKQPGASGWEKKAQKRRDLMHKLMVDPKTKLFYDYDFVNNARSKVYSAAAFTTLWLGVASNAQAKALVKNLGMLEAECGLMACAPSDDIKGRYQWHAPNGWAPFHFYAIKGLDRYGFKEDACRIALKYVQSMENIYTTTGQMWEKFNAREGNTNVADEYPMPGDFMGWTAGAYQTAYDYLYGPDKATDAPRVVNILLYIRQTEPRRTEIPQIAWLTDSVMFATVGHQMDLLDKYNLPSTWMIQYDAMVNPEYPKLLKERLPEYSELGGWYEITQPHVEDAGLTWRGRWSWDYFSNVGFSVGYTPEERIKLVDVYMEKFKEIFGYYPKIMGSWFIDSVSLNHMREKYGIVASCCCRDQLGTDGYNLWGGYWAGGFYPSKKNWYVPAQTREGQIDVPTFRMLGSDPIDQYDDGLGGRHQRVFTLEAIYPNCGGNPEWVNWYFNTMVHDPAYGMTYFHCGQEQPFGWRRMKKGLEYQWPFVARLAERGDIKLQLLSQTGLEFSAKHKLTPPTALLTMSGYTKPDDKTLWYNCRNYRFNLLWEGDRMFVRDLHLFDQTQECLYLKEVCTTPDAHFFTMPVVEGNVWSNDSIRGCMRFYAVNVQGKPEEMKFGTPTQKESKDGRTLTLYVPVKGYDCQLVVTLDEKHVDMEVMPLKKGAYVPDWYLALEHAPEAMLPFGRLTDNTAAGSYRGFNYTFNIANATFADRRTAPRNHLGALTAFTITPDKKLVTFQLGK